ncbi:hypothetical protein Tco_0591642 [Tanacetum coccineum]
MGDANPVRTLGDYSKPSHEGYRNTIELPVGNNVVPLRSDTIRLVQNGYSFHELRSEDPNQHLKYFLKLVDSLDLDGDPSPHRRILLLVSLLNSFYWEGLQKFATISSCSNNLLQKVPHHGLRTLDYAAEVLLRKLSAEKAWSTIEKLAQYEDELWNDPVIPEEGSLDYKNPDIEQLLGVMKYKVDALIKNAISLMGRSKGVFRMESNEMYQIPPEPSRQEDFEHIVMNFILDQKERVKQLKEYIRVIMDDFMQLSSEVIRRLKEKIIEEGSRIRKFKKITKYLDIKVLKPLAGHKFSESFVRNPQSFNNQSNLEGLVSNFMASQDARLSKFEADFKRQQSDMTDKIDTVLKDITDQIVGALPSDTVKNLKLNVNSTTPVLLLFLYNPYTEDPPPLNLNLQIEQYDSLSDIERVHTKSVYFRNEENKRRGVEYVMSKILGFYKECLELGPEYMTGIADEGEVTLYLMRRSLEVLRKFHWTILGGRFNQLSHVSSPLLSKPWEY